MGKPRLVQLIGKVPLTPRLGKVQLTLTFAEPGAVGVGVFCHAMVALAAAFKFGALFVGGGQGAAAGVAAVVLAGDKAVAHGHPPVKNITFAVPFRLFGRHVF